MCTGLKYGAVCQILCWLQKKAIPQKGLLSDIGCFCLTQKKETDRGGHKKKQKTHKNICKTIFFMVWFDMNWDFNVWRFLWLNEEDFFDLVFG